MNPSSCSENRLQRLPATSCGGGAAGGGGGGGGGRRAACNQRSAPTSRGGGNKQLLLLALVCFGATLLAATCCCCCSASPTATITGGGGAAAQPARESKGIFKRSFAGLGCLGVYDKAKFARLDRVCEECYTLYREPDIHTACRQDCFRNNVFTRCVDALLLSHEAKKFDEMVDELYGK